MKEPEPLDFNHAPSEDVEPATVPTPTRTPTPAIWEKVEQGPEAKVLRPRPIRRNAYVGRNQPCPCNSGKKFKHCCRGVVV